MKISYQRTGGMAGMVISHTFDTTSLPDRDADDLIELLSGVDLTDLLAQIEAAESGVDRFQYILEIETDDQHYAFQFGETSVPEDLQPLLEKLRLLTRNTRGTGIH